MQHSMRKICHPSIPPDQRNHFLRCISGVEVVLGERYDERCVITFIASAYNIEHVLRETLMTVHITSYTVRL